MVGGWTRLTLDKAARAVVANSPDQALHSSRQGGRRHAVLSAIALVIGALAALPEFIGGAHPAVVVTTFIIVAGICFYLLERLKYLIVWLAIAFVVAFIAILARQIFLSVQTKAWVSYRLTDLLTDAGLSEATRPSELAWLPELLDKPAGLIAAAVAVVFTVAAAFIWPWRRGRD